MLYLFFKCLSLCGLGMFGMAVEVRVASLDDVGGIVDVYCSGVDRWFRWIGGGRVEANYGDLGVVDRWSHGGPWMSVETCAVHLNFLLTSDQYPLVAVLDGRVVGELELYVGEERGCLGKTAFIDVLEVHRDFRRMGVRRALVGGAIELARENDCDTISVWPAKGAVGFYGKCGLSEVAYDVIDLEVDLDGIKLREREAYEINEFPNNYVVIKGLEFITPRIESSYAVWLKSRWRYAVEVGRIVGDEGFIPELQAA